MQAMINNNNLSIQQSKRVIDDKSPLSFVGQSRSHNKSGGTSVPSGTVKMRWSRMRCKRCGKEIVPSFNSYTGWIHRNHVLSFQHEAEPAEEK